MTTFDFERLLIEACRKHGVFFAWVGIFVVERSGLEKVLKELPPQVRVLGLDAYRFDGHSVALATDYWPLDLGNGKTIDEVLAMVSEWPRDDGLWIEPVLSSGVAPWS